MANITLFAQIIQKIDRSIFNTIVRERKTDKGSKGFESWTQIVSMLLPPRRHRSVTLLKAPLFGIFLTVFVQQLGN